MHIEIGKLFLLVKYTVFAIFSNYDRMPIVGDPLVSIVLDYSQSEERDAGVPLRGLVQISFHEPRDLIFHKDQTLSRHSNGMRFRAFDEQGSTVAEAVYYSPGGGFIVREGEEEKVRAVRTVPHPFSSAAELLELGEQRKMPIWKIVLENEKVSRPEDEIRNYVERIWFVRRECVLRGLQTEEFFLVD